MRILALVVLAFVVGAVVGWGLAMGAYIVQTELFGAHDQDGGGAMAYGLVIGPAVGLGLGIVFAVLTALRLTSRPRSGAGR
ncbi:hypothetical protein [Hyphomicrobium sp.]|uniref:hypothetical protein n=1 Tax=Hyphomicrobium sp. TaxID=82 RepID=UPI002E2FE3F4|nr:hypothetical protein [Hyphomicrobium sp.]HEX2841287.1 hypothetical protein [Hyphomicrobium sp.]